MPFNSGLSDTLVQVFGFSAGNLFAGTGLGVFLSGDSGKSWRQFNKGIPFGTKVNALIVDGNYLFVGTNRGVFLNKDTGASWISINSGLEDTVVQAFALFNTSLFAATTGGVFFSADSGSDWTSVNSGLTNRDVFCLAVSGNNLFAGTRGNGVFTANINSLTGINEFKKNMPLVSIFPNPANADFVISTNCSSVGTLQIFDMTGKIIFSNLLQNGAAQLDAGNIVPGVYDVRFENANGIANSRLEIIH